MDDVNALREIDDRTSQKNERTIILGSAESMLAKRLPFVQSLGHPPVDAINRNMAYQQNYMRAHLITTHTLADIIERDVVHHMPDVVVLFLVDGLAYGDVLEWICESLQPCFVDGPSVTYRFLDDNRLNPRVGFASIINRPSVHERMYVHGYHFPRGFTYWQPESNTIADFMFEGIPFSRVANFESILHTLATQPVASQTYLQIVREGLDGLAHGKRELQRLEIESAVQAILNDVNRLIDLLSTSRQKVRLYLTSDHGILWKTEHAWELVNAGKGSHARFTSHRPSEDAMEYVVRAENVIPYYLFRYPYLGTRITINDSGVHGGLSYQELITPLAIFQG